MVVRVSNIEAQMNDALTHRHMDPGALDFPELARVLGPMIEESATESDRIRRLTPNVLEALHDNGLYRMLLPRVYNGHEVTPRTFFETIETIASFDASTAWCLCQANGCAMSSAYLEPHAAQQIWGNDPRGVLAWGPGPGKAVVDGDGYRLSGKWSFASGGRHANWLGCLATVIEADGSKRLHADGQPRILTLLIPEDTVEWTDIWDVIGLRATGSDAYACEDLYVPAAFAVARDEDEHRRCDGPLYQFPAMSLYAMGFSGTALGIAGSVLSAFLSLAQEKKPRLAKAVLRDNEMVQAEVAQCEARLKAARALLTNEIDDIWAAVVRDGVLTIDQRMRIRLATTFAIHEAKQVVDVIYDAAGASAIFTSAPYERRFRDIHTVAQQLQGRKSHFRTVGAYRLGHEPDLSVV